MRCPRVILVATEAEETHTFVIADLVGYTALTEAHGDARAADVAEGFCREVTAIGAEHGAEQVKTIGDAVLLRVADAGRAVRLGSRLVHEIGRRHQGLSVRVGMHTGTAVRRGADWFGTAVNVAARVADRARGGEVLLTRPTLDAAAGSIDAGQVRSTGSHELKNVRLPVELFALVPEDADGRGELPVDPVCRMSVDPEQCFATLAHAGQRYTFCSAECRDAFAEEPRHFVV